MLLHVCKHASTQAKGNKFLQPQSIRILESGVPQPAMHWPQKVCHVLCPEPSAKFIALNVYGHIGLCAFYARNQEKWKWKCISQTQAQALLSFRHFLLRLHKISPQSELADCVCVNRTRPKDFVCQDRGRKGLRGCFDFGRWPDVDFATFQPGSTAARSNENFK